MRREFPKSVRVACIKRATRSNGQIYCELCGDPCRRFQIDHKRADGLLGEPTIENAQLICEPCWSVKNPQDASAIAKAKRREAAHLGAKLKPGRKIAQRPRAKRERRVPQLPLPPRRHIGTGRIIEP